MQLYRLRKVQETIDHAVDAFDFFQRNGAGLVNIRIIGRLLAHLHAKPDGRQRISNLVGNAGNQPSQGSQSFCVTQAVFDFFFTLDLLAEDCRQPIDR